MEQPRDPETTVETPKDDGAQPLLRVEGVTRSFRMGTRTLDVLRGVDLERDIEARAWMDLREVEAGEACPMCETALEVEKTIEVAPTPLVSVPAMVMLSESIR